MCVFPYAEAVLAALCPNLYGCYKMAQLSKLKIFLLDNPNFPEPETRLDQSPTYLSSLGRTPFQGKKREIRPGGQGKGLQEQP